MSHLHDFIQRILAKRQSQKPRLERAQRALGELAAQLGHLTDLATDVNSSPDAPPELKQMATVLAANLGNLKVRVTSLQAKIANLLVRFGKNTITIGVAGKARQGKSTLLQRISGLDDTVIPTSDGLPCTGTKSRILHQEHDPHSVIEFYSEEEFLKGVVHAYYEELLLPHPPPSLADFQRPLPSFASDIPEKHAVYRKLQEMHASLGSFSKFLSHRPGRVDLERVRGFVSQDEARKLYLAVKCATIYVPFPNQDVTGLGIVDLPGLGEIAQGHGQKLVASLQQEVDAVILIKLPGPEGALWDKGDFDVFNRIKQAVPELDLAEWLFPTLNETGQNARQVELLKTNPPDVGSPLQILSANCRSADEVDRKVFSVVLRHLQDNLERTDQRFVANLSQQLALLADDVEGTAQPARKFFDQDRMGMEDAVKFNDLHNNFLIDLSESLELLVDHYRRKLPEGAGRGWFRNFKAVRASVPKETGTWASEFQKAVDEACSVADNAPSVEDLKARFFKEGGWQAVLQAEQHYMRSHLTRRLAEAMDNWLRQTAGDAQGKMLNRLLADPLSRVQPLVGQGESDARSRIQAFRELLSKELQPKLREGLEYLLTFNFSYQTHLHYRVRQAMDPLDPMTPAGQIKPPGQKAEDAEKIAARLATCYRDVVSDVKKLLCGDLQYDAPRAIFALVEETKDRLVRAKDVNLEWYRFLYLHRGDI